MILFACNSTRNKSTTAIQGEALNTLAVLFSKVYAITLLDHKRLCFSIIIRYIHIRPDLLFKKDVFRIHKHIITIPHLTSKLLRDSSNYAKSNVIMHMVLYDLVNHGF